MHELIFLQGHRTSDFRFSRVQHSKNYLIFCHKSGQYNGTKRILKIDSNSVSRLQEKRAGHFFFIIIILFSYFILNNKLHFQILEN